MEEKIRTIVDSIVKLHKELGMKIVLRYVGIGLLFFLAFNFKTVIMETIQMVDEIKSAIHNEEIAKRDELILELPTLLAELRAETGADRLLYIEYHNSKENLVGIPFKYLDLVLTMKAYGAPEFDIKNYHELNAGILSPIFPELKKTGYVVNAGSEDPEFAESNYELVDFITAQDGSVQQVYLNLPGVNTPIGIIILEWVSEEETKNWDEIVSISRDYVTRINGLVLSKSRL